MVHGDHAGSGALLAPRADAAQVKRVADGQHANAMLRRALDAERHGFAPDDLPVAGPPVDSEHGTIVHNHLGMLIGHQLAIVNGGDVARQHSHAVAVMPG